MTEQSALAPIPAPWQGVALVCRKCGKKLGGGFGKKGKHGLAETLKRELKDTGRRRALRVVEVGCLGLCPKGAVTVAGSTHPGAVFAVPAHAEPAAVLTALLPGRTDPARVDPAGADPARAFM